MAVSGRIQTDTRKKTKEKYHCTRPDSDLSTEPPECERGVLFFRLRRWNQAVEV